MPHFERDPENENPTAKEDTAPDGEDCANELPEEDDVEAVTNNESEEETEVSEDGEASPEAEGGSAATKALSFAFDLTELFAISFAVVIVLLCFFLRHSPVSGSSMEPTIQNLDTLLVSDFAYTPDYGDIVIVQSPHNLAKPLVKRVIALGGDKIEINFERWMIMVNGEIVEQRLDENGNEVLIGGDYVNYEAGKNMLPYGNDGSDLYQIGFSYDAQTGNYYATVPEGRLFILGDNRKNSKDSRDASVGFVDQRLVVGKAFFRLLPFSSIGTLD